MTQAIRFEEYIAELKKGDCNCIIVKDNDILRFSQPGVKSLMKLIGENPDVLKDSYVFDTVVGKGASALMILGGVKEIYAELISDHAIKLLEEFGIKYSYGKKVPFIRNRMKTGLCPIESLAITCTDPKEIHEKILNFISQTD